MIEFQRDTADADTRVLRHAHVALRDGRLLEHARVPLRVLHSLFANCSPSKAGKVKEGLKIMCSTCTYVLGHLGHPGLDPAILRQPGDVRHAALDAVRQPQDGLAHQRVWLNSLSVRTAGRSRW